MSPYLAGLRSGASRGLHSPGELVVRLLFYVIILVVFAALWRAATDANGGSIAGYDFNGLFIYIAGAEGAVIATKPRMIEEIGDEIGSGEVAVGLLRPVDYAGFRLSVELGEALVRLCGILVVAAVIVPLYASRLPTATTLAVFAPSVVLAVACNLSAQHAFGAVAFWLQDAKASWFLYQKLIFLLGGMLLPLQVMPSWLAHVAAALPFAAMAYAPARILSGHPSVALVAAQAAWLMLLLAGALGLFRLGQRRLQIVGG